MLNSISYNNRSSLHPELSFNIIIPTSILTGTFGLPISPENKQLKRFSVTVQVINFLNRLCQVLGSVNFLYRLPSPPKEDKKLENKSGCVVGLI